MKIPEYGIRVIADERAHQLALGYTPEHDEHNDPHELAKWASEYLSRSVHPISIDGLAKAGALIAAAIDCYYARKRASL